MSTIQARGTSLIEFVYFSVLEEFPKDIDVEE
jgi:hypothetical protein